MTTQAPAQREPIKPQGWRILLASLIQFGRSQDGSVERDLVAAIERAIKAAAPQAEREWSAKHNPLTPPLTTPPQAEEADAKRLAREFTAPSVREMVMDCLTRMRRSGESYETCAAWISALVAPVIAEAERRGAERTGHQLAEMVELFKAVNPGPSYIEALGWAVTTFGSIAAEPRERVLRFIEEALEVASASDVTLGDVRRIADRAYTRPRGDLPLEIAQAGLTLGTLAAKLGVDIRAGEAAEFERIKAIPKSEWTKRHASKTAIGITADAALPLPGDPA